MLKLGLHDIRNPIEIYKCDNTFAYRNDMICDIYTNIKV